MKSAPPSSGDSLALVRSYRLALKRHLGGGEGPDLKAARRIGQRALKLGLDTLSLAKVHEGALAGIEPSADSTQPAAASALRRRDFFDAAVSPLEESRLAAKGVNGRLERTIETLKRRTEDLAATNSDLRDEIARRKKVEKSLRTSESTSSLLLKKSRRLQEELRFLSRRLLTVQEDERKRISRELHDVLNQALAGINVRLAVLRSQTSASARDFHETIGVTEQLVAQSVEMVHRFASDLRPLVLDDLGLVPALRTYLESYRTRTGLPARLISFPGVETLDPSARTALFRIAQEALANVARHAKAGQVRIDLRPGKACVRMRVRDDGKGFDVERHHPGGANRHLGLLGMRERAEMVGGSLRIQSQPGAGTTVSVEVPLAEPAPENHPASGAPPPKQPR